MAEVSINFHHAEDFRLSKYSKKTNYIEFMVTCEGGKRSITLFGLPKTRFRQLINLMGGNATDMAKYE